VLKQKFYNRYHLKNKKFSKVIGKNNFTYFYLQELIASASQSLGQLKNKHVLDVGCGVGSLSLYLTKLGAKVDGIDISSRAIKIAQAAQKAIMSIGSKQEKQKFKNLNFKCLELKKGRANYDLIICSEVIEHIPDDQDFLLKLNSHLKKDGLLILTTPSPNNFFYKLGLLNSFDQSVGHLRRYSESELRQLLAKTSFDLISIREKEGPIRTILFTSKLGCLIRFIKGPLVLIFHCFDDLLAKLVGANDWQLLVKKQ
jgi:ubiquinone biosynthesis O-methyltransferase